MPYQDFLSDKVVRAASTVFLHSFSGGKDSTAMYLHFLDVGLQFQAVFADTGNEHPATLDYVRELPGKTGGPEIQWIKADFSLEIERKRIFIEQKWPSDAAERALQVLHATGIPFLDLCLWKGRFPSMKRRFCTTELKVLPIREQVIDPLLSSGVEVYSCQGTRREESLSRQRMDGVEHVGGRLWNIRPIREWKVEDVFAIHRRFGIKPNPLYSKGMSRVGCLPCINCRKGELHEIARRFPEQIERIRAWEEIMKSASKLGVSTFFYASTIPGKGDSRAHVDAVVSWAATSWGGKRFDLLKIIDPAPCSSEYGLCE
jgi:3'-phosphoadenosine 5'-phosphosulfate sulfotransferase (PAPS reductase)/FAD synthetase